jgi:hypothetical protein
MRDRQSKISIRPSDVVHSFNHRISPRGYSQVYHELYNERKYPNLIMFPKLHLKYPKFQPKSHPPLHLCPPIPPHLQYTVS